MVCSRRCEDRRFDCVHPQMLQPAVVVFVVAQNKAAVVMRAKAVPDLQSNEVTVQLIVQRLQVIQKVVLA